ncbi:TIGR02444 family protein [Marinobacterium marinum]|uniref:TIGR02444 family protein n=1 Tax=Marinobacterium marinum TaxID=2756129 RepID=A0A7W2ABP4_9GAMM|nr:TIGR02444 family protein [Marinobacterium marinum]MBA4501659.1 TIGR02444 family protein [Marinobacterium marinum]
MALDNPLWHYALALYAEPGIESTCLQLQRQGAAINRLLLACWLGGRGVVLDAARWRQLDSAWRTEITEPLRLIRYRVRALREQQPETGACYQALRQAELAAEQVELMQLYHTAIAWPVDPARAGRALIRGNLISYCRMLSQASDWDELTQLADAAAELSGGESELSPGRKY